MKRFKWLAPAASTAAFALVASVGCNGLLGNEEGTARVADASVATDAGGGGTIAEGGTSVCDTSSHKVCFGVCVGTTETNTGCGGTSCAACDPKNVDNAVCNGGTSSFVCAYKNCKENFGDCDMNLANGCETSLLARASCGGCGMTCLPDSGAPLCAAGPDGKPTCVDQCPVPTQECTPGSCVDTSTSTENCGKCGVPCSRVNATAVCTGGMCVYTCQSGTHACGSSCASDADPMACGTTCTKCPAPPNTVPNCTGGACGTTCEKGFLDCDGDTTNGCEFAGGACPAPSGCPPCIGKTYCCVNTCIPTTIVCMMLPPGPSGN